MSNLDILTKSDKNKQFTEEVNETYGTGTIDMKKYQTEKKPEPRKLKRTRNSEA